jgi:hypothetical protein
MAILEEEFVIQRYKLKENHPLRQKFEKLSKHASDMKVEISFEGCMPFITDLDTGVKAYLEDIDCPNDPVPRVFPIEIDDYKIILMEKEDE